MLDKVYDNIVIIGPRLEKMKLLVKSHIGRIPKKIIHIRKNRQVYKLVFKKISPMRLDIGYPPKIARMQQIAYDNKIEVPKIIKLVGKGKTGYKYSEWITGVLLMHVWNLAEVFYKSGDLMGRMNLVQDPVDGKFLSNSEWSAPNAVWTPDKKIYIIDHGRMKTVEKTDMTVVKVVLKRIRNKERINVFLDGYSQYKNVDFIKKQIEARNWYWNKSLRNNLPPLEY